MNTKPRRGLRQPNLWLLPLVAASLSAWSQAPQDRIDAATGLVIAEGWEQVRTHCGSCHSFSLVTQNRGDAAHWLHLIRWMQAQENLWALGADEAVIVDYLAGNYAAGTQVPRRQPLDTQWLEPPPGD